VILGNVVQAGVGPNPARLAAAAGGIPMGVPASTVNKLCLSGLTAIAQAAMQVGCGYSEVVVAGGMESMSNAPHLLPGTRGGLRYGAGALEDALDKDALVCGFDGISMGAATDRYQARHGISRPDQDAFAAESHARAASAIKAGRLAEEITPVATVRGRKGDVTVEDDEGVRPGTTAERLATLPAAFGKDGSITAGSASQLSDGACAVVVMSRDRAGELGLPWLAELGSYGTVAGPDPSLLLQPANAIRDALRREAQGREGTLDAADLDLIEINEAFAGVALASTRTLGVSADRVNVNGGAIALGHPVGMSGARLALTLAMELRRRGGGTGAAALCGGGGQGDALILRVPGGS
jgi:acetyl-CoA C-acetyltransferase